MSDAGFCNRRDGEIGSVFHAATNRRMRTADVDAGRTIVPRWWVARSMWLQEEGFAVPAVRARVSSSQRNYPREEEEEEEEEAEEVYAGLFAQAQARHRRRHVESRGTCTKCCETLSIGHKPRGNNQR